MSDDGVPGAGLFLLGFVNNLLYLASLVFLLVQLAGSSTTHSTRFDAANGDL